MRISLAILLSVLLCATALAQQNPNNSSGVGPGGQGSAPGNVKEQPPATTACDPSFQRKYSGLIRQLAIEEDAVRYGNCHDYGAWSGTEYKGHTNLPPGAFWTYSAPNWYIWSKRGDGTDAAAGCPDPTFNSKYSGELRRLNIPGDRGRYGACNDYGPWSGTSYAGHTGLPNGYWVYTYPYWIIYANRGAPKQ